MYKKHVQGEIQALGWREGASGKLMGDLEGFFQGYRLQGSASTANDYLLEIENSMLALTLSQEVHIRHPLPSRPQEHPFKNGNDPFAGVELVAPRLPELPAGSQAAQSRRNMSTVVKLVIDPSRSTGTFAGAQGEMNVELADPKVNGRMTIETNDGIIELAYREHMENAQVFNTLRVEGEKSTGIYKNAKGELHFHVSIYPPNFSKGTYTGELWLEDCKPA
jgi:hypothetical protein